MFDFGWVMNNGLRTFFRNLPAFGLMALLVFAPLVVLGVAATTTSLRDSYVFDRIPIRALLLLANALAAMLLQPLLAGAVTYTTVEALSGRDAAFGASLKHGLRRFFPSLAVGFLVAICTVLGVIGLIVGTFIVAAMLYVAVPASVIERPGVFGALRRSAELTSGCRGWIFLIQLITGMVPGLVTTIIDRTAKGWEVFVWSHIAVTTLGGMFGATMCATTYVGLRNIKDGIHASELAKIFD
jgi:hypothetical protein